VFDIVEQTVIHQRVNRVFKRYAPLSDELFILLRTPVKGFHHRRSYQNVCLLASSSAPANMKQPSRGAFPGQARDDVRVKPGMTKGQAREDALSAAVIPEFAQRMSGISGQARFRLDLVGKQPILSSDALQRHLLNVGPRTGVLEGNCANVSLGIQVQYRVLVQVPGLGNRVMAEFDVKRVRLCEVFDFHGLNFHPLDELMLG
jgi:hypothetical protein